MEQNSRNLVKGVLVGCFIATIVISLAHKSHADEISKPLSEQIDVIAGQSLIPAIYYGSRHMFNEECDIWALSTEQAYGKGIMPGVSA